MCLGRNPWVRIFMLRPGEYVVCMRDLFYGAGNDSPSVYSSFIARSPYGKGNALAGLLLKMRHMIGRETCVTFAPVEVALTVVELWWEGEHKNDTKAKLTACVELLIGDIKSLISEVSHL